MTNIQKARLDILNCLFYILSPILSFPLIFFSLIKRTKGSAFLFSLFAGYISYMYVPPYIYDKARHIEFYNDSKYFTLSEFFAYNFQHQPDFLFRLLIYIGSVFGIKVHFVFFFITFISIFLIMKVFFDVIKSYNISAKYSTLIVLLSIFSFSYINIFSGMRYFLALSFLFCGIYYAYIKNIKSYYVYLFLACITHYSLFFFVFILLAMPLLKKFKPKTISFFLILSFLLLLIPPEIIFKSLQIIGLTSSLEAKVLAYLSDDGYKARMDSFVYYLIRFINVIWIYLLIVVLILRTKLPDNKFIKLLVWSLIFNNVFIAFPVVFDRYALFIKLLVVIFFIIEYIKNEKIIIPLLFLSIFILIALVDFVQLLDGFLSIFNDKQNWWLIYQLFENNFSVDQLK